MTDFNGSPAGALVHGDRTHTFVLPLDRSTVPAKTGEALDVLEEALKSEGSIRSKKPNDHAAHQAANEAVRDAVHYVYDTAAATSRARAEHHREGYNYASAKFIRAIAEAQAALQLLADHMQQADNPVGVGFKEDRRANSPAVLQLHVLADTLRNMPAVPELV